MKIRTTRISGGLCLVAVLFCSGRAYGADQIKPVMDMTISTGFFVSDKSIPLRFYSYEEEPNGGSKRRYIKSTYNFTGSGMIIANELTNAKAYGQLAKVSQDRITATVLEARRTRKPREIFKANIHNNGISVVAFLGTSDGIPQLFSRLRIFGGKQAYVDLYAGGLVEGVGTFSEGGKSYLSVNVVYCGASACSSELKIFALPPS